MGQHCGAALSRAPRAARWHGRDERRRACCAGHPRFHDRCCKGSAAQGSNTAMNGVQDMGGMQGFGPILAEKNEPVFHATWEGRVLALNNVMAVWGKWNIDRRRYVRELIPAAEYLR